MKQGYRKNAVIKVGLRCMVFPDDEKDNPYKGSRFFHGVIRDVFGEIITVEITESTWLEFKKGEQLWFPPFQIWAEFKEGEQLSLEFSQNPQKIQQRGNII